MSHCPYILTLTHKYTLRNSHIIRHTLRRYLGAAIFAGIIIQLNCTIDSMVAGQFIGADAVSVIILALPLVNILMLPGTILLMGAALLIAPAFGNQDYGRVNRVLTVGLASALAVSALFTVLLAVFSGPVSLFITRDARLQPMLQEYLPFAFAGSFFGLFACAGSQFVQISGRPRLVAWFVGIFGVLNLALDLLFIRVLGIGIRGAAAGTSAAALLGFLVMVPYLLREPRPYRLCRTGWAAFRRHFREILSRGTPAAMTGVSMIVLNLGLNTLVLNTLGADGMFTLSICMQLLMICMLVLTATGGTITGLGGILSGEEDWDGVNRLISIILKLSLGLALVVSILLLAFPDRVALLFGANAYLAQLSAGPLRIFSGIFLPASVLMTQASAFLLVKRGRMAAFLQAGIVICTLPLSLVFARWNLWTALPAGMVLAMLGGLVASAFISHRKMHLHPAWLTPTGSFPGAVTVSTAYSQESVSKQFRLLCEKLEAIQLTQTERTAITHCIEEMMLHQLEMGLSCGLKGSFDVGIVDSDKRFTILVKAAGRPYNPLLAYGKEVPDSLSLRIVEGFCKDINYRYASGVNCVYLNFEKVR
ncbi:MAG: polysaccharide biosynthesis C-terminal domain-containing protein [Bacteroidales bacterium]|nr:polysaccharide biosynthesis C-terminal domain-containing protein [Bacteroidales bacterium]